MQISPIDALIPHYCCSCGAIGRVLCESCKYDIISEPFEHCLLCAGPARPKSQLCGRCRAPFERAWCVGERSESLKAAINLYKFESVRASACVLAELLHETIPVLDDDVRVVAVPTIAPHVRARGYDHAALLAKRFARRRGLAYRHALMRAETSHQQGSSRLARLAQAKRAFRAVDVAPVPYLLIDDVYTTGATAHYAAKTLRDAGATSVYVAVLARQPLEKE